MANNYKGSNNKKRRRPSNRRDSEKEENGVKGPGSDSMSDPARKADNDVSWYSRYPNLLVAAGQFPYPYKPGMDLDMGNFKMTDNSASSTNMKMNIPGVLVLDWMPTVGKSLVPSDPASVLAKEMYARVRKAYSGRLTVDAPDYVIYLMALDSVYSYIAWLKRLYRVLNAWSPENYAVPDQLLNGMGLNSADIQSLRRDRTQLWQYINELILQSRKFTCPGTLDIINRHYWMNDNVYLDAPSARGQMYMFNQKLVYYYELSAGKFPEIQDQTVGSLIPQYMPWYSRLEADGSYNDQHVLTASELRDFGLFMIDKLVEWDDAYTAVGYLQRAYEGDPMFVIDELPQDAIFQPVYSPEVLMQIENSATIPFGSRSIDGTKTNLHIQQNPADNSVLSNPVWGVSNTGNVTAYDKYGERLASSLHSYINSRLDNPSVLDNVISTRLKAGYTVSQTLEGSGATAKFVAQVKPSVATEIPLSWRLVRPNDYTLQSNGKYRSIQDVCVDEAVPCHWVVTLSGLSSQLNYLVETIGMLTQFDWHPMLSMVQPHADGGEGVASFIGDIHNIAMIERSDLENLHKVCQFSEFNSFSMA